MFVQPSDRQLVAKLQSGDLDALGVLYERHKLCVYRTALAITNDLSAAENILQDCFLRLHRYARNIDHSLPLQPWLYRVAINLAYNWEKSRKNGQTTDRLSKLIHYPLEIQADKNDVQDEVMNAISALDTSQRIVIVLFYLNSFSVKEIAAILGCPVGTVQSRLNYSRENLRRELEARGKVPAKMI
jgi:RNA polymerase sigma-70 factor (ECF subfamily)